MFETKYVSPLLFLLTSFILSVVGIGGGSFIALSAIEPYLRTRNWVRTQAFVATIQLHKKTRGRRRTSVRCESVYTYVVNDRRYKGTNSSLYKANPFGTFQKKLCERLQAARRAGKSTCWYDVNNPSQSAMEKAFVPELLLLALLLLALAGSAGLIAGTKAITRLRQASLIGTGVLYSVERDWPAIPLVTLCYWLILAILALPISINTCIEGVLLSLVNVFVGIILFCGAVLWMWVVRRSRNGGILLVPNEFVFRDVFTLRVPSSYSGDPRLVMTWYEENNLLVCSAVDKPTMIYPLEMRTNTDEGSLEVDFVANSVPDELPNDSMCALRISGDIGETAYVGTFLFGTALELRDIESRRHLGPSLMFSV